MIPLMKVLRVKPEGATRAGLVEVIPDTHIFANTCRRAMVQGSFESSR